MGAPRAVASVAPLVGESACAWEVLSAHCVSVPPAGPHGHWRCRCVAGAQLAGGTLALGLPGAALTGSGWHRSGFTLRANVWGSATRNCRV